MKSPFKDKYSRAFPARAQAATGTQILGKAPFAGELAAASLIPAAAVTGAVTDKRTFTIVNKGQSGAGTTVMATINLNSGNNLVAFDEKAFVLSVVANALDVVQGDVIALVSTADGAGVAESGGVAEVSFSRTV